MIFDPNTRKNQYLEIWDICQKYLPNNDKLYGQTLFAKFSPNIIWKIYGQTGPQSAKLRLINLGAAKRNWGLKMEFQFAV